MHTVPVAKLHLGTSSAVIALMSVYETSCADEVFKRAYSECVGGNIDNALTDFRLYRNGETVSVPPYLERACRKHGVWPFSDSE